MEMMIVSQLVKKFLTFYGAQVFIMLFATARHWYQGHT
jgi:hypothetical protein